jgi:hypothetical protein
MLSPSVTRALIERFGADPTASRRAAAELALRGLTARGREVAGKVALGVPTCSRRRPGLAGMAGGDFPLGGQVVDPGGGGERVWGRGGHQD